MSEISADSLIEAVIPPFEVDGLFETFSYLQPSKLSFENINDKKNVHTGYFQYRVGEDGRIYCRWDPVLAKEPFRVSCSNRLELPMRAFDAKPWMLQSLLSRIVGPYKFKYEAATSTVLVTPRKDLDKIGFILKRGKLVEVPLEKAVQWHLHDRSGGPKLPSGVTIEEIQVANEAIFARGSDNIMYFYSPGVKRVGERVKWGSYGFFDKGTLTFPKTMRDWTAGASVQMKPWQRRGLHFTNPYTDVDSYYGDGTSKIAHGVTITLGVIPAHGHTIQDWDTGLPPDLHRGFLTPDRGRVQARRVAQAGSVWLVLGYDRYGMPGLYKRTRNYETHGACIGMKHSCEPKEAAPDSTQVIIDLGDAVRTIPLEGWSQIAFPHLEGLACITDRMSVHCTGEGDAAREIRLEGRDESGRIGFYFKTLHQSWWSFRVTSAPALCGQTIDVNTCDLTKTTPNPVTRDYDGPSSFSGFDNAQVAKISLLEFHPYQTQSEESTLRFTLQSGRNVDVYFRTADAWSPFKREQFEDATVWQGVGVAKILVGTLDIPEALLSSEDPEVRDFVAHLRPYHHAPNIFEVIADLDNVQLYTSGQMYDRDAGVKTKKLPPCSIVCTRDASGETFFEKFASSDKLQVVSGMSGEDLLEVIKANESLKGLVVEFQYLRCAQARSLARRWKNMAAVLLLARAATRIAGLRKRPFIGAVLDLTPRLVSAHRKAFKSARKSQNVPKGITDALALIDSNLAKARELLEQAQL